MTAGQPRWPGDPSCGRQLPPIRHDRTVAHVIAPAVFGGAESVVRALASGRRRLGGPTEVIALVDGQGPHPFVDELRRIGVPTHAVRCGQRRYWAEARAVADILCRIDAHVVHTHVYHADFVGYLAARRHGASVIATIHTGGLGGNLKDRMYVWADRQLLRMFDRVICVSHQVRMKLLRARVPAERLVVVSNGHDGRVVLPRSESRARLGLRPEIPVVGWMGRLSSEKGPDLFLRAFSLSRLEGAAAVMVGTGAEQARLLTLAAGLRLDDGSLRMAGHQDAPAVLRGLDVLVISSRTEGLPMVLLEAMAAGTPVVAFAVGGIPEVLSEESGWVVQPGNVAALGAAIRGALENREERDRRAAAARQVIERRFGLHQWVKSVEAVYTAAHASRHEAAVR